MHQEIYFQQLVLLTVAKHFVINGSNIDAISIHGMYYARRHADRGKRNLTYLSDYRPLGLQRQ